MSERAKLRRRDPSHGPVGSLREEAIDIQALANTLQARASRLAARATELRERARQLEGGSFSITDHALVQYCKRYLGMDMDGIRNDMLRILETAVPVGTAKSEAVLWGQKDDQPHNGVLFVVVRGRLAVTVVTKQEARNVDPVLLELAEREGFEPPDEV